MYAVIEDSGSQIMVRQGDKVRIALRDGATDQSTVRFDRVLLLGSETDESAAKIGAPLVAGASVEGVVQSMDRTDKVPVMKYKRRKNYRRKKSHRQDYLTVEITAINA